MGSNAPHGGEGFINRAGEVFKLRAIAGNDVFITALHGVLDVSEQGLVVNRIAGLHHCGGDAAASGGESAEAVRCSVIDRERNTVHVIGDDKLDALGPAEVERFIDVGSLDRQLVSA